MFKKLTLFVIRNQPFLPHPSERISNMAILVLLNKRLKKLQDLQMHMTSSFLLQMGMII